MLLVDLETSCIAMYNIIVIVTYYDKCLDCYPLWLFANVNFTIGILNKVNLWYDFTIS